MNYDRFLTRVFDKQEKRMLYAGTSLPDTKINNKRKYEFIGTDGDGILFFSSDGCLMRYKNKYYSKDRFIPMQCLGKHDKNKKLIYADDIVATSNNKYLVYWDEESAAFWFERLDNECEILIDDFGCEIEIIGNKWEHPALLEESRC